MEPLTQEQRDVISNLLLEMSVSVVASIMSAHQIGGYKAEKSAYWMKRHDDVVQTLRDLGINGPSKFNR